MVSNPKYHLGRMLLVDLRLPGAPRMHSSIQSLQPHGLKSSSLHPSSAGLTKVEATIRQARLEHDVSRLTCLAAQLSRPSARPKATILYFVEG